MSHEELTNCEMRECERRRYTHPISNPDIKTNIGEYRKPHQLPSEDLPASSNSTTPLKTKKSSNQLALITRHGAWIKKNQLFVTPSACQEQNFFPRSIHKTRKSPDEKLFRRQLKSRERSNRGFSRSTSKLRTRQAQNSR